MLAEAFHYPSSEVGHRFAGGKQNEYLMKPVTLAKPLSDRRWQLPRGAGRQLTATEICVPKLKVWGTGKLNEPPSITLKTCRARSGDHPKPGKHFVSAHLECPPQEGS